MKRLRRLLWLCEHKYETIEKYTHTHVETWLATWAKHQKEEMVWVLRCEKCWNIKVVKTK